MIGLSGGKFKVKSKSKQATYHIVTYLGNNQYKCSCTAGQFNAECSHKKIVKNYFKKNDKYIGLK